MIDLEPVNVVLVSGRPGIVLRERSDDNATKDIAIVGIDGCVRSCEAVIEVLKVLRSVYWQRVNLEQNESLSRVGQHSCTHTATHVQDISTAVAICDIE